MGRSPRTEPRRRRACAALRAGSPLGLAAALACGDRPPGFSVHEEPPISRRAPQPGAAPAASLSEADKVAWLGARVEASGRVFLRGRRRWTAGEFADRMREIYRRHEREIRTAREFVERVGRPGPDGRPIQVRLGPERTVDVRAYLHDLLDALERGEPVGGPHPAEADGPPAAADRGIPALLDRIERSGYTFLVPQRKGPPKAMDAHAFADMLARKWHFLGADVEDPETFVEEIASEPFGVFAPYLVVLPDGTRRPVAQWLRQPPAPKAP